MKSVAGKLLIAIPELPDTNFYRTVVFVTEHTADGAMGVIINRPTNVKLDKLWQKIAPEIEIQDPCVVYAGGPVEGPILALHDQFNLSDHQVIEDVFLTMSGERLNQLVTSTNARFKIFNGYSGWGPQQLDMEIDSGGWMVTAAHPIDIFASTETLWKNVCERIGRDIMFNSLMSPNPDVDPNLN